MIFWVPRGIFRITDNSSLAFHLKNISARHRQETKLKLTYFIYNLELLDALVHCASRSPLVAQKYNRSNAMSGAAQRGGMI